MLYKQSKRIHKSNYAVLPFKFHWPALRLFEAPAMLGRQSHTAMLLAWVSNASGRYRWGH